MVAACDTTLRKLGNLIRQAPISMAVLALLLLFSARPAQADSSFTAHAHKVQDGDSLEVITGGRLVTLRLWGIDCPEHDQPYGRQAKARLAGLVAGRRLQVQVKDIDSYQRGVALVTAGGVLVNEEMVRTGAAWVYTQYCQERMCGQWQRLQDEARQEKRGLWRQARPQAPWKKRQQDRERGH